MEDQIKCPKCSSTQITADKKGFSGKKAVAGALLTGGIGLLAGTLGSNKVIITCLACGHKFKPGEGVIDKPTEYTPTTYPTYTTDGQSETNNNMSAILITIVIAVALFFMIKNC